MLSTSESTDVGETGSTGCLVEVAVEGLMSWAGEGSRFMDADWIVEAISMAGFDIFGGKQRTNTSRNFALC